MRTGMNEVYQLLEQKEMIEIALCAREVESFCDADATKSQEEGLEDFARCDGRRDGLVVGNGKSRIRSMPTDSV